MTYQDPRLWMSCLHAASQVPDTLIVTLRSQLQETCRLSKLTLRHSSTPY